MTTTITVRCEDCDTDIEAIAVWIGHDEDGFDDYELLQGADTDDDTHIADRHDLSIRRDQ